MAFSLPFLRGSRRSRSSSSAGCADVARVSPDVARVAAVVESFAAAVFNESDYCLEAARFAESWAYAHPEQASLMRLWAVYNDYRFASVGILPGRS